MDIHLDHLEAEATGLTNARSTPSYLPAEFHATGRAMGHAPLKVDMKLAPLAEYPTFDLNAELTGFKFPQLNDFFRAYAKVDVEDGPLKLMWEAVVAGVTEILENQPKDQVATQVPISGSFENPEAGIRPLVGFLLRNAFLQSLRPSLDRSIALGDVKAVKAKGAKSESKEIEREKKKENDRQDGTKVSGDKESKDRKGLKAALSTRAGGLQVSVVSPSLLPSSPR